MKHPTEYSIQHTKHRDGSDRHPSPLAYGAILLSLYVVMYLAVAAILHVAPTLSIAMAAVSSSLGDARRAIVGEPPDRGSESGGRLLARAARATIDINCD